MSLGFDSHSEFNSSLLFTQGEIHFIPYNHRDI